jgi:hypothetical protein
MALVTSIDCRDWNDIRQLLMLALTSRMMAFSGMIERDDTAKLLVR